jgi:hypothetical protein
MILDVATGIEHDLGVSECADACGRLSWSPDGRSLLVSVDWPDVAPVGRQLIVDIETGDTTELPWVIDGGSSWQRVALD